MVSGGWLVGEGVVSGEGGGYIPKCGQMHT